MGRQRATTSVSRLSCPVSWQSGQAHSHIDARLQRQEGGHAPPHAGELEAQGRPGGHVRRLYPTGGSDPLTFSYRFGTIATATSAQFVYYWSTSTRRSSLGWCRSTASSTASARARSRRTAGTRAGAAAQPTQRSLQAAGAAGAAAADAVAMRAQLTQQAHSRSRRSGASTQQTQHAQLVHHAQHTRHTGRRSTHSSQSCRHRGHHQRVACRRVLTILPWGCLSGPPSLAGRSVSGCFHESLR